MHIVFRGYSLSLKNCQAIERGYDVYELAKENYHKFWSIIDESGLINHTFGYVEGFQKALELMGDKKFSEDDMKEAYSRGFSQKGIKSFNLLVQSLQQTEWDVEIETVPALSNNGNVYYGDIPKKDEDGCLILKRL